MENVWLIGMMGSGKTTVGRDVAERLDVSFIDTDDEVVLSSGRSIEDLFTDSEIAFRSVEHGVIVEIASSQCQVVATGGGAVLSRANVVAMRGSGTTILLDTDPDTLRSRLAGSTERPLLTDGGDIGTIARDRAAIYAASADVIIETTDKSIPEVVDEVVACVTM